MRDINPIVWFGCREMTPTPKHFVKAPTAISDESLLWVVTKLQGRYSINNIAEPNNLPVLGNDSNKHIFFEDPADAMMYELRWSGGK